MASHRDSLMDDLPTPPLLPRDEGVPEQAEQTALVISAISNAFGIPRQTGEFNHPMLFGEKDYSMDAMAKLPKYASCND